MTITKKNIAGENVVGEKLLYTFDWNVNYQATLEICMDVLQDEPIQVIVHKHMEAMLGISLYSYLYLKLAKMQEGRTGSAWKQKG
jgi:hypothetical protein